MTWNLDEEPTWPSDGTRIQSISGRRNYQLLDSFVFSQSNESPLFLNLFPPFSPLLFPFKDRAVFFLTCSRASLPKELRGYGRVWKWMREEEEEEAQLM